MIGALQNAIRLQALRAMSGDAAARMGLITSYDPANFAVRVQLQPEGFTTGWLPLCTPWVGNGWGMFCAPSINDMVTVHFLGGDLDSGFAESRIFNDVDRPLSVPSGEFWLVHASGAFFKLTNDGKATFSDAHGASVALNGDGTITSAASSWNHTGPINVTGNVAVTGGITASASIAATVNVTAGANVSDSAGSMATMRTKHNTHRGHGSPGTGNVPDQLM